MLALAERFQPLRAHELEPLDRQDVPDCRVERRPGEVVQAVGEPGEGPSSVKTSTDQPPADPRVRGPVGIGTR